MGLPLASSVCAAGGRLAAAFQDHVGEEGAHAGERQKPPLKRHRGRVLVLQNTEILLTQVATYGTP